MLGRHKAKRLEVIKMRVVNSLLTNYRKVDKVPMERLEYSKVRNTIEEYCEKYLVSPNDIFKFEALPNAIDSTIQVLESPQFQEKYEFNQVSETCFIVRLKLLDIL